MQIDLIQHFALSLRGVIHFPVTDFKDRFPEFRCPLRIAVSQIPADHTFNNDILRDRIHLHIQRLDGLAVTQNGYRIRYLLDFVQFV
ncbi:hypothetical protein D3C81_1516340 [compost metagenome]